MAVIKMSIRKWIDVPDNPRQRNTVKRAKYAVTKHLKKSDAIHRYVFAACRKGELLCKLDGHTRSYLWENGQLEETDDGNVEVCLVECSTLRQAAEAYSKLDSPRSVERPSDAIYGFVRENKFGLTSALLRSCQFSNQLRQAEGFSNGSRGTSSKDLSVLVKKWKPEMIALDSLQLSSNYTTLIAFMLLAIKADGIDVASSFLQALDKNEGTKTSSGMDGVEALSQNFQLRRAEGRLAGYENLYDLCDRAWTAYSAFKNKNRVKRLRSTDLASAFVNMEKKTCQ